MALLFTSGNETVDRLGQLDLTLGGAFNMIPNTWYKALRFSSKRGSTNLNACVILSEICYWYKPQVITDELGNLVSWKPKFAEDVLQKSYQELADKFGITKRQASDAVKFLEDKGLIKREFRNVITKTGMNLTNVLFIHLNVDRVSEITYPEGSESPKNKVSVTPITIERDTYHDRTNHLSRPNVTPTSIDRQTYTKNTTEITTKITTSPSPSETVPVKDTEEGEREQYKQLIANNINLDSFLQGFDGIDPDRVRMIYDIMVDTVCSKAKTIRINSENMSKEVVKSVFLKLGFEEVSYVCAVLDEPKEERIGNLPGYIRTLLYNSLHLAKEYWSQKVNYDQYGGGSNNSKMEDLRKKHGFKQRDDIDFDELERKLTRN